MINTKKPYKPEDIRLDPQFNGGLSTIFRVDKILIAFHRDMRDGLFIEAYSLLESFCSEMIGKMSEKEIETCDEFENQIDNILILGSQREYSQIYQSDGLKVLLRKYIRHLKKIECALGLSLQDKPAEMSGSEER